MTTGCFGFPPKVSHVTAAVVKAIFVVILMDGLFAMFYAAIDF